MAKQRSPRTATMVLRNNVRKGLHAQLDALLNGTTDEQGTPMSVIDSMTLRALEGFHFNVRVHSLHPSQTQTVEAGATVHAGPALGLVRGDSKPEPEERTDASTLSPAP